MPKLLNPKLAFGLFALAALCFGTVAFFAMQQNTALLDNFVYGFLATYIAPPLTSFAIALSVVGSGWVLAPIALLLWFLLWRGGHSSWGLFITLNLVLGAAFNYGLKHLFTRPRPNLFQLIPIEGYSFPSGHSFVAMAFFGFLIYLLLTRTTQKFKPLFVVALGLLVLLIGLSRIYLGVHYASDVLGGFFAALAWLSLFCHYFERRQQAITTK